MTEKQYQKLLDRIKFDLYQEFINPETASYGIKYVEDEPVYEGKLSEREILQDELGRLCTLQNKFIDDAVVVDIQDDLTKIINLQNKIDKL